MPNIHPFLIHFPLAILSFSVLCELIAVALKHHDLARLGWWGQLGGTIGLAAAVATGLQAGASIQMSALAKPYFAMHEELAFVASALYGALLFWRISLRTKLPEKHTVLFLMLYAGGILVLLAGAWYGGEMVYRFGVGVRGVRVL